MIEARKNCKETKCEQHTESESTIRELTLDAAPVETVIPTTVARLHPAVKAPCRLVVPAA